MLMCLYTCSLNEINILKLKLWHVRFRILLLSKVRMLKGLERIFWSLLPKNLHPKKRLRRKRKSGRWKRVIICWFQSQVEYSIDFWQLLKLGEVTVTQLNEDYEFKSFDCGNTDLNDFLLSDSKIYLKYLRYTTTLLETENRIIAYYSLANDLLNISDRQDFADEMEDCRDKIEFDFWERFLNQKMYPAAKIGRLAVDKNFQDQGIGTFLIRSLVQSLARKKYPICI